RVLLRADRQASAESGAGRGGFLWLPLSAGLCRRLRHGPRQPLPRAAFHREAGEALIRADQALEIIEFDRGTRGIAQPAANFVEDFAGALDVDGVGDFHREAEIGPVGAVGPAERISAAIALATALFIFTVLAHLLRHGLSALVQLIERLTFGLGGVVEIFIAERVLGFLHRFARALELLRCLGAFHAHAVDQALQLLLDVALPAAEAAITAGTPADAAALAFASVALRALIVLLATRVRVLLAVVAFLRQLEQRVHVHVVAPFHGL